MRYILDLEPHDREGPFAQLTGKLCDRDGRPLENLEKPVAVNEIRKGVDVRDVGEAYVATRNRDRLGDHLWYRVHGNPAFSVEVASAIDRAELAVDPTVYRWPLHVLSASSGTLRRDYVFFWAMKLWPVLDLARADVEFFPGTDVISDVKRWVFDEGETPPYDLFRTSYFRWIASERMRQVIIIGRYTGFSFIPVA